MSDKYSLTVTDCKAVEEAAEWFLDRRKPATSQEVRKVLVTLYLKGMLAGTAAVGSVIKELVQQ